MSNRQHPSRPDLRIGPLPTGTHSHAFGAAEFQPPAWFKEEKVKPCKVWKVCGIKSNPKAPHHHPVVES